MARAVAVMEEVGEGGLTATEHAIFTALATYRFLTAPQLLSLKVTSSRRYLYRILQRLSARHPRIIRSLAFGVHAEKGHLPALYYLTPAGAELLAEANQDEPVAVPERVHRFANDYFHRINTVDCHIAIRQWAADTGSILEFFDTYFDHSIGRKPRTQVALPKGYVIPDAMFRLIAPDGEARLFALEIYNGRETHRVERQLARYLAALENEAIEDAYSHPDAVRVLCVFDELRGLELVMKRLADSPEFAPYAPQVFFKTLLELRADFLHSWRPGRAPGTQTVLWEFLPRVPGARSYAPPSGSSGAP